jgi:glycosyltransferase involved in cell wall biosynthesis
MSNKTILFVHNNFPAQFKSLAPALAKEGYNVHTLSLRDHEFKNITHHKYDLKTGNTKGIHKYAIEFEAKMIRGQSVALKCLELKENGLLPDLIIAHPGWGESYFLKEVWRDSKFLSYFEFYYNTHNSDIDFDLNEEHHPNDGYDLFFKVQARNAPFLKTYMESDAIICPTNFQKNTAPPYLKNKIDVIHDGIDTSILKPKDDFFVEFDKKDGTKQRLTKEDKVITFVNRNFEPYRGYHKFMEALPDIVKEHPDAYIVLVGGDGVSYGNIPEGNKSYREIFYDRVKDKIPNKERILFTGQVDYKILIALFGITTAHVYLTYPFVLSWSFLEAMSMGALVIGSKTAPVEEVVTHNKNGLLVDFHDVTELIDAVNTVLSNKNNYDKIKKNARKTIIENYDLKKICLPKQIKLIKDLI